LCLKIVGDENVNYRIIKALREKGIEVLSIHEEYRGISDEEVLKLVVSVNGILLTEDSDFGEWVFAHKKKAGVIFLRYPSQKIEEIIASLLKILEKENLQNKFVVITPKKVRIREL